MIYLLLITAVVCFIAAAILFLSIPEHGGDEYMEQGLMAMEALAASLVFLVLAALTWLWQHLHWV